jgi:hypothetical protein
VSDTALKEITWNAHEIVVGVGNLPALAIERGEPFFYRFAKVGKWGDGLTCDILHYLCPRCHENPIVEEWHDEYVLNCKGEEIDPALPRYCIGCRGQDMLDAMGIKASIKDVNPYEHQFEWKESDFDALDDMNFEWTLP